MEKFLGSKEKSFIGSATSFVFNVSMLFTNILNQFFYLFQTIVWHPEATDFELCLLKGKNKVKID